MNTAKLADWAITIATRAAVEYMKSHNLKANPEVLSASVKTWLKAKLPEALDDAKEAFDCGMTEVGAQTFTASMVQAGIEAAKECAMPQLTPEQRQHLQAKVTSTL